MSRSTPAEPPPAETPPLPRTVDSDAAAGAVTGLLDSDSTPEEVEEVVSFIAAVPLGVRRTAPRWVAPLFAAGALVLVPWIVYLGLALPERSTDRHYNLAWVGFDLLLLFAMTRTALLAWKGPAPGPAAGGRDGHPAAGRRLVRRPDVRRGLGAHAGAAAAFLLELPIAAWRSGSRATSTRSSSALNTASRSRPSSCSPPTCSPGPTRPAAPRRLTAYRLAFSPRRDIPPIAA